MCLHQLYLNYMEDKKVLLCILDGWGENIISDKYNAIKAANTPYYDILKHHHPFSVLKASGKHVGLPDEQVGNSEVGHMTIGAGRILQQDLLRINEGFENLEFYQNYHINSLTSSLNKLPGKLATDEKFVGECPSNSNQGGIVHLIGVVSDGGVHGDIEHIIKVAEHFIENKVKVLLHFISDGRDVSPYSAKQYLAQIQRSNIKIATISGRFYAMDRDNNIERTNLALDAMAFGGGVKFDAAEDYIDLQYELGNKDEYIIPASSSVYEGFCDGDVVFFLNYRADRMIQLVNRVISSKMGVKLLSMTEYHDNFAKDVTAIYKKQPFNNSLSEIISKNGLTQVKIAETEKYAHVTYFFNLGLHEPFEGEDRVMIPSKGDVDYSKNPKMSSQELTDCCCNVMDSLKYNFICINYASPDMVGHTGNFDAAVEAVAYVDLCVNRLMGCAMKNGYESIIIADHGNVDCMYDEIANQPMTSHTNSDVPCIYVGRNKYHLLNGELCDVAPTILKLLSIDQPSQMTGKPLILEV